MAGCPAARRSESLEGALLSRPSLEAGQETTPALDRSAPQGSDRAWLPNQSVDHGPNCRGDGAEVQSQLSLRSCRSVDAQLEMESSDTRAARRGAERCRYRAM